MTSTDTALGQPSRSELIREQAFRQFLDRHLDQELLRFTTAGSVDDGKSTLIGRLLHDTRCVYEDQLASIRASRINHSGGELDLSLRPMVSGQSESRESRSMSPTVTFPPRSESSSSPTLLVTSSTPATWPLARLRQTSPSCSSMRRRSSKPEASCLNRGDTPSSQASCASRTS